MRDTHFPLKRTDKKLTFGWQGITNAVLSDAGYAISGSLKRQACRRAIVSELLVAAREGRWLSYSRREEHYSVWPVYAVRGFTYTNVIAIVEELRQMNWIEEQRSRPGDLRWQSRMRAKPEMVQCLQLREGLIHVPVQLIILKDADGKIVRYQETRMTRRLRRDVEILNQAFSSVRIELPPEHFPADTWFDPTALQFSRVRGYRVFNGSWERGGRLYGPFWQSLAKAIRKKITINGAALDEPDFQHIHPRLLYALHGAKLASDAYFVRGFETERQSVKVAWQIVMNSSSRQSALSALVFKEGHTVAKANKILGAVEERHEPIRSSFYSGVGVRLQAIDSGLMMDVELAALADGIIALPIHDSFLVPAGRPASRLREHMENCLGRTLYRLSQ
ncbi:MAG: hypothetical protein Q7T86_17265 [Hyphomicrobiaceae bacterium]|nr:hypothetical protein [Hyphomicrobiaceae bacterium]